MSRNKPDLDDQAVLADIGARLRAVRDANGLSQEEIADLVKVSRKQWIAWEKGEVTLSAWAIRRLMLSLDVDPAWLLDGPGDAPMELASPQRPTRYGKIKASIMSFARDLGLTLPPAAVARFTVMVSRMPEDTEKANLKNVREILRGLAMGKAG